MAKENKTSAAHTRATEHREKALQLRRAGHGYRVIGERLGLSKARAHQLVQGGAVVQIFALGRGFGLRDQIGRAHV